MVERGGIPRWEDTPNEGLEYRRVLDLGTYITRSDQRSPASVVGVLDSTHVVVKTVEQFVFHMDHLNKQKPPVH